MNEIAHTLLSKEICDKIEYYELSGILFDNSCILYIHIVPKELTGTIDKYYVGITSRAFRRRCGTNGNCYKSSHFRNAINKYGWDNISHIVITDKISKQQAYELEKLVISYLHSNNNNYGYNISEGGAFGGNVKPTVKVSQYTLSGEYVASFESAADAGRAFGCDRSIISHVVDRNLTARGYQWKSYKVVNCGKFRRECAKYVYQYDPCGNLVNVFDTIGDAVKGTNIPYTSISKSASANKIAYGYYFSYEKRIDS